MTFLMGIFVFLISVSLGSFFKLVVDRYNSKDSFIFKPSYCPSCKNKLYFWHNIPIVGCLLLGGRCFFCKSKIDLNNLYAELITGFLGLVILLHSLWVTPEMNYSLVSTFVFFMILILLSMFDLKHRIIPHEVTYLAIVFFILYKLVAKEPYAAIFLNLGIAFLALDVLCFFVSAIKGYELEQGLISVPLLTWTIYVFFNSSHYFLFIPIVLYFVLGQLKINSNLYKISWTLLFVLALVLFWKFIFINFDLSELINYLAGIGITYFICEIISYFFSKLVSKKTDSTDLDLDQKVAFGGGDITVFVLISVFFGYKVAFLVLFIASLLALISHFTLSVINKFLPKVNQIPFVPFLTLACFIILVINH